MSSSSSSQVHKGSRLDAAIIDVDGIDELIQELRRRGYETKGPVVRSGAIVPGPIQGVHDFPKGMRDDQGPGTYRLIASDDEQLFGWSVGAWSWKSEFFPASQVEWRAITRDGAWHFEESEGAAQALAIVGARPCDVAAWEVLDRVLAEGPYRDPRYADRRATTFVAVAECSSPGATCFCASMSCGPAAAGSFDLALTELDDARGHRFVARIGSPLGRDVLESVRHSRASDSDLEARSNVLLRAEASMGRRLETEGLAQLLARNLDHPRWGEVAERCLSCANCTMVCPTCFCSDVRDTSDVAGVLERRRSWSSCFDVDHSYLHGGAVRASTSSRYRQWMTHKLSSWWDQFDTTGCVGCGRCITWCPVGIDITEEAAAIVVSDGASRVAIPTTKGAD